MVIEDFADALRTGHLAGGAADVFPQEPKKNGEGLFKSPLQGLANVILTPHIGGSTEEAQEAIGHEVALSMIKYINTGVTYGAVNFPQVRPARVNSPLRDTLAVQQTAAQHTRSHDTHSTTHFPQVRLARVNSPPRDTCIKDI